MYLMEGNPDEVKTTLQKKKNTKVKKLFVYSYETALLFSFLRQV